jgi:hypothetical protein
MEAQRGAGLQITAMCVVIKGILQMPGTSNAEVMGWGLIPRPPTACSTSPGSLEPAHGGYPTQLGRVL